MTDEISTEKIEKSIKPVVAQAGSILIDSPETYTGAIDFLKEVKGAQKRVSDFFAPMKTAAYDAWKAICSREKEVLGPLTEAESEVKRKALTYQREEERKRAEEERRLQAEADEAARKERERLEKKAAKLKTPEKREALLEEAKTIEAPVISIASRAQKVVGVATRKIWRARITDEKAIPREWLVPNEKALNEFAKATKGKMVVPGVEFYAEENLAVGGDR